MNEFVIDDLSKGFKGPRERYNDTMLKEFSEAANPFMEFLEDDVCLLEILMGFVKDKRCSIPQFVFKVLAVLFVSLLGNSSHNRHQFRFAGVVVYIKMLCPMDVPIETLCSDLIFSKSLRPSNSGYQQTQK